MPDVEVTSNDEFILQNINCDDFTLEEKTKDVVVAVNICLGLNDFKDFMDKKTKNIIDNNYKNSEKIREEIKIYSTAEKEAPEKSSENLNSIAFHELD